MSAASSTPVCGMTLINGEMGRASTLRIQATQIASVGTQPGRGDLVIDLKGDRVLPGLINAHDHLQLNHFGRLKYRETYFNVCDWITDIDAAMKTNLALQASHAIARNHRLWFGALKNLLSGVTTVAHHDPLYDFIVADDFPIRAVRDYGWSHSLLIDGDERVRASYCQTPPTSPWIIHAAEGLDDEAALEFARLEALGCIGANTLIVHGLALDEVQRNRLARARAGLIWCPASNLQLFGRTADVLGLVACGRVALGSDSRLSGERDLLRELHVAREISGLDENTLESLVTVNSARLLRLADRGVLQAGAAADILVLPPMPLSRATRADVRMVMIEGRPLLADPDYAELIAPASQWAEISIDGRPKALNRRLATLMLQSGMREPGLEIPLATWKAA